jgi:ATP-dependent exoDNAse (exonuclease V) alpha subunit/predicted SprT family Zn-dependent metalloprotease
MATSLEELKAKAHASILAYRAIQEAKKVVLPIQKIEQVEQIKAVEGTLLPPETEEDRLIHQFFDSESLEQTPEQTAYIKLCLQGKNCILVGAAGTGKTTVQGITAHIMMHSGRIQPISKGHSTKYLQEGLPGVAIVSFTNRAVNNIRYKMPKDLQAHCITIHKLLEFAPVWYEVEDLDNPGEYRKSMRFEPTRNKFNPLPSSLRRIVIEESSMVETGLYALLLDACPHDPQIILLGDLNQLPPIFGSAILGFKMLEWPIVELTKIFRQAAESPIISFAWDIKNGKTLDSVKAVDPTNPKRFIIPSFIAKNVQDKLHIRQWQKKLSDTEALFTAVKFFSNLFDAKEYDPDEDIILIPFNKAFGSIELNNGISQYLGEKRGAIIHEVIAGFKKYYLAVGDKVMYQKEDAYIEDIVANAEYLGKPYQRASKTLDRWGQQQVAADAGYADTLSTSDDMDKFLEAAVKNLENDEDRTTVASHTVVLRRCADNAEIELDAASEINNLLGGYAITIHKAQGSEWRKVFCVFHHTHATMLQRELLYTAVTRARESLYILCEPNTFERGVLSQKIKGTTLAEKAEYFKGKQDEMQQRLEAQDDTLSISPIKIKVADLVDDKTKQIAQLRLEAAWLQAEVKFGKVTIGIRPVLDFNLYRKNCLGLANYTRRMIKLNPVYLMAGDENLANDILGDTIVHEVCHFLSWRLYKQRGHGYYWQQCMIKMGVKPERLYPDPVPPYLVTKIELVNKKFEELRGQRDITPKEEGDEE